MNLIQLAAPWARCIGRQSVRRNEDHVEPKTWRRILARVHILAGQTLAGRPSDTFPESLEWAVGSGGDDIVVAGRGTSCFSGSFDIGSIHPSIGAV